MQSPFGGCATAFPPLWEACHLILSRLRLLANPVPLPPQFGGAAIGKRLNGQARRLTSPHLEVLCRTSTGALQGSAKPCTHKLLYFKHGLFCPLNRGKSGAARIGGGERSEPIRRMLIMSYATESKSRNADFISIARKGNPQPSARRAVKLSNL